MTIFIILAAVTFVFNSFCIDLTCIADTDCPAYSICNTAEYCQCNNPYILDCTTQAQYLTSDFQNITLTNTTTYFQTQEQPPDIYYSFLFQACAVPNNLVNYQLNFSLWVNNGASSLSDTNFVGTVSSPLKDLVSQQGCINFVQYQIKLENQPNKQTENLIVGLKISPQTPSDQVNNASAIIRMNVSIKQITSSSLLIKLSIGIISASAFIVVCVVAYCCYSRWKARRAQKQNKSYKHRLVEDFKKMTPQYDAKQLNIPAMTTCSICLGDFQPTQKVRKTVCKHIFHSQCIESWCLKNLSCPVCRLELDEQSIKRKKRQIQMSDFKWNQNALSQSARSHLLQAISERQK